MTDQTACRPGTIATITLPAGTDVVSTIVAGAARIDPEVRAVSHGGHLDLYGPATAAQDGQERPGSVSGDSGACGGGCEAAGALDALDGGTNENGGN